MLFADELKKRGAQGPSPKKPTMKKSVWVTGNQLQIGAALQVEPLPSSGKHIEQSGLSTLAYTDEGDTRKHIQVGQQKAFTGSLHTLQL
jgi:hypothetical protein